MLVHVVLFRPRPGLADSHRAAMFDALRDAAKEIPTVTRFQVGSRLTHGARYEQLMPQDYPYAAFVEFDDLAGLQTYLQHPAHERLGELFYALQEAALAYDYFVEQI